MCSSNYSPQLDLGKTGSTPFQSTGMNAPEYLFPRDFYLTHLMFKDVLLIPPTRNCPGQHSMAKSDSNTWIYISEKSEYSHYIQSVWMASSSSKVNPAVPTLLICQGLSVCCFPIPSVRLQTMIMVPSELLQCRQLEIMYSRHFDLKNWQTCPCSSRLRE